MRALTNSNEKYVCIDTFLYRVDSLSRDIPKCEQYLSLLIEG